MRATRSFHSWRGIRQIVVVVATILYSGLAYAQPRRMVAIPSIPQTGMTDGQDQFVNWLRNDPAANQIEVIAIDPALDSKELTAFEIELPSAGLVSLDRVKLVDNGDGIHTWVGRNASIGAEAILVIRGPNVVGTIRVPGVVAGIRPLGGPLHVLVEWELGDISLCEVGLDPLMRPTPAAATDPPPTPCPVAAAPLTSCKEIWLVVGYTTTAMLRAGVPIGSIEQVIVEAVEAANLAYESSDVNLKLVLKNKFFVPGFAECCTTFPLAGQSQNCLPVITDRDNLVAGISSLKVVHEMRDLYAADVAALLTGYEGCGGIATIPACPFNGANEAIAFTVVSQKVAAAIFGLAHEIGHIQSAWHNPEMLVGVTRIPVFAYGHGYCNQPTSTLHPDGWNTIMSYATDSNGNVLCKDSIAHFSNPNVEYPRTPVPSVAAVATGDTNTYDVARVLNDTACTVTGYREPAAVTLSSQNLMLRKGDTAQIIVTTRRNGNPVTSEMMTFSSSDTTAVIVNPASTTTDASGQAIVTVEGLAKGAAGVTARCAGGEAILSVEVFESLCKWLIALGLIVVVIVLLAAMRRKTGLG